MKAIRPLGLVGQIMRLSKSLHQKQDKVWLGWQSRARLEEYVQILAKQNRKDTAK